jgi:LacI family repressor for deo operon, udp, cdd, tsx, nupC, and nupG
LAKVGIKDIAVRAGVSIATVSHAFRNPGRVSDATRNRVLAAAAEVGYTPNNLAVSLRTARSGNIVVIIPDVADSYNSGIIKAIEKGSAEREREFAAMTRSRQADGIILMSHRLPFDIKKGKLSIDDLPPLVNGCEFTGFDEFPSVSIDDELAAVDATTHLIELGHSNIAIVTGDIHSTSSQRRLKGFRSTMEKAGIACDERLIVYGDYSLKCGETATRNLLMQKVRPTAIFCFSDEIALGCMYSLREQGFHVPDDVSVIGFDDIPFARYFAPPLTTVAQPAEEIGITCATLLLDLIDGIKPIKNRHILQHKLLVRQSTGPLK